MTSKTVDTRLIEQYRAGDLTAAEALVHAHQPQVFRLALSILDDAAEADEAAQEALLKALNALEQYRGDAQFSTWLYRITVNECRGRLRRRHSRERLAAALQTLFRLGDPPPQPEESVVRNERDAGVWRAINALDEKHRVPLVLHYYHDLPTAEIAQILEISEGTVHSRLHTARGRIRAQLKLNSHV